MLSIYVILDTNNKPTRELEYCSGLVERITFHSEESGFAVLRVKVTKRKDLVTVTGSLPSICVGEYIHAKGYWINDSKHGLQFKAEFIKALPPNTLEGIEKYLGSGLIKGIGPHFAKRLVGTFGEKVFEVIENSPSLLSRVEGIGKIRAKKIISNWAEQKVVREIMVFLQSHGVSTSRSTRIYKTYGEDAIEVVSENPYRLARDITGIGFITADRIAKNLGITEHSMIRARAGLNYILTEALSEGYCGLPRSLLLKRAEELLTIPQDILIEALSLELAEEYIIEDTIAEEIVIFLGAYAQYEKNIAFKLKTLAHDLPIWNDIEDDKAIEWVESKLNIELAENQKEAIRKVISSKVTVITGGPGTGKTTLLNSIIKILKARKYRILLCAPTGRAAKRLSETTGLEAFTVHRLLKFDPKLGGFKYNQDNLLKCDALVIDESSMVDIPLMNHILKALPQEAGLMIVGDVDQLPSVGPGQVLKSIIDSQVFNVVRLTQIFRQAQDSDIITNAHKINQGMMPNLKTSKESTDFYFIETQAPEEIVSKIIQLVKERIPKKFNFNPIEDIQVLCPMQRGGCGAVSLNISLQQALNNNIEKSIQKYGHRYAVGDKVMQIENNYDKEVYNGDIGRIKEIDFEEQELVITYDDKDIRYDFNELDEIVLAYAVTIHKSQGSEYPVVIIPLTMQHYAMLQKNLLYTGITRGKKLVIVIGQKKAVAIAVRSKVNVHRYTKLKELLENL